MLLFSVFVTPALDTQPTAPTLLDVLFDSAHIFYVNFTVELDGMENCVLVRSVRVPPPPVFIL